MTIQFSKTEILSKIIFELKQKVEVNKEAKTELKVKLVIIC